MAPAAPEAGMLKLHACLQVPAIPGHPQKPPNPPGLPQQLLSLLGPSEQLPSHPGPQLQSVPSFNDDMDMDMS